MKVMQINCVYKRGSTGKIVNDIHSVLQEKGYTSIVCYGRGQNETGPNIFKTSSEFSAKLQALNARISGIQYGSSFFSTNKLINLIKEEKPNIVHLQCINGYFVNIYRLLNFLKKQNVQTVLTLHAEFMYTGGCGIAFDCERWKSGCGKCPQLWNATKSVYFDRTDTAWGKMEKSFRDFDNLTIVSVSNWLDKRAKQSPFLKDKRFTVVKNGIDTKNVFHPVSFENLKKKHNLTNEKIIVHVTASFSNRLDDNKGGRYVIQLAEKLKNENVKIMVIGCRDNNMNLPGNIINVGRTNNQNELAAYYSMADLSLITSRRETFSMPCAESLSCGTPIVGFLAGGPETISLKDYSEFVNYGDIDALEVAVKNWIDKKADITVDLAKTATEYYSKERMTRNYINLYTRLLKDN
ncbi:glycosyltransferase [Peribacillus simplex]|uniref:glycosyltransferase n=1 Tax=Peribacillus simplex TaxID=1478 RepID=UPI00285323B7|nr:glycosyltransferase [Peribacillus simplex]MDR4925437.1 glycosyltransferase [Peribacillus simplex]